MRIATTLLATAALAATPLAAQEAQNAATTTTAEATGGIGPGARPAFHISIIAEKGRLDMEINMDASPYLTGVRDFVRMFKTGRSEETEETMLGPVVVLEALEKSVARRGARVAVSRVGRA